MMGFARMACQEMRAGVRSMVAHVSTAQLGANATAGCCIVLLVVVARNGATSATASLEVFECVVQIRSFGRCESGKAISRLKRI